MAGTVGLDRDDLRALLEHARKAGTVDAWADAAMDWANGASDEIARLKRGEFRPDEVQKFCHNLPETVTPWDFAEGCARYQRQLYGRAPDADAVAHWRARAVTAEAEVERLRGQINTPRVDEFLEAVRLEAVHQRERWGTDHDAGKNPEDWFWLVGYLSGKALHAAKAEVLPRYRHKARGSTYEIISVGEDENRRGTTLIVYRGEDDGKIWARPSGQFFDGRFEELPKTPNVKALHHCVSTAAALMNWHAALSGADHRMRPGTDRRRGFDRRTGSEKPTGKAVVARAAGDRRRMS